MKLDLKGVTRRKTLRDADGKRTGEQREIVALEDVTFAVKESEVFTIIGPSGSGKTTLLRLINRLEEPTSGTIWFNDRAIDEFEVVELRRRVALVAQVPTLFEGNVEANLRYPVELHDKKRDGAREEMTRYVGLLGLNEGFLGRRADQLSEGEKQRICIARALMNEPEVLLLDEPTSALDPTAAHRLLRTVREIRDALRITILMVTHRMEHAREVGDRTLLLVAGKVVEENTTAELFANPREELTRAFLRGELDSKEAGV
jgi:ABC-type methionine transport system ATPase subunit